MRPAGMCHTLIIRTEGSDRRVVNQCEDDREEGGEGKGHKAMKKLYIPRPSRASLLHQRQGSV